MLQTGDKVLYGIHGVCQVTGTDEKKVDGRSRIYLVLEPLPQDGSKYLIPMHNAAAMEKLRPVLTPEALLAAFQAEEIQADGWIQNEGQRKQVYRELIGNGDRIAMMRMVCTLYRHRAAQLACGRKCHLCDENFIRDAEKLLVSEFSVVMGVESLQARQYIREQLRPREQEESPVGVN